MERCDPSAVVTAAVSGAVSAQPESLGLLHQTQQLIKAAELWPTRQTGSTMLGRQGRMGGGEGMDSSSCCVCRTCMCIYLNLSHCLPFLQVCMCVSVFWRMCMCVTEAPTSKKNPACHIWLLKQSAITTVTCSTRELIPTDTDDANETTECERCSPKHICLLVCVTEHLHEDSQWNMRVDDLVCMGEVGYTQRESVQIPVGRWFCSGQDPTGLLLPSFSTRRLRPPGWGSTNLSWWTCRQIHSFKLSSSNRCGQWFSWY